jgi:hypothetical protein
MAQLHFIGGEVGGSGKSTFCMVLNEAYLEHEVPYHLRDADRTTPNVGWAYDRDNYPKGPAVTQKLTVTSKRKKSEIAVLDVWAPVVFSEDLDDFSQADRLIDLAQDRDVLVNLPAQVSISFDKWLQAGDFLSIQAELGIRFVYWWVARAEQRSIDLLLTNATEFPGLPHVLVRNHIRGVGEKWDSLFNADLEVDLDARGVKSIDMQELILAPDERGLLDRENPRFRDLLAVEDKRLSLASKARCRSFLKKTITDIVSTGFVPVAAPDHGAEAAL